MDPLMDVIRKRLAVHKIGGAAEASEILLHANRFFNAAAFPEESVRALHLERDTLMIGVTHAVWAQEVQSRSDQLLKELHERFGAKRVMRLRIKSLTAL